MKKINAQKSAKIDIVQDSKPAQLAKIMYDGIVRMIEAKKAREAEKKPIFELDSKRKRRVNVHDKD